MDRRQKSTLRRYQIKLAEELILDEDFYAALRQNKLFTEAMVATIRAEATDKDRIYRMLKLLPKRGPHAFSHFVAILRENFGWVADMLENGHAELCSSNIQPATDSTDEEQPDGRPTHYHFTQRTISSEWPALPVKPRSKQYQSQYSLPNHTMVNYNDSNYTKRNSSQTISVQRDFNTNTGDTNYQDRGRNCKDACVSPIHVIESPRKYPTVQEKHITIHEERETVRSTYSIRQQVTEADNEFTDNEEDYGDHADDGCPNASHHDNIDEPDSGKLGHGTDDEDYWVSASDSEDDVDEPDGEMPHTYKTTNDNKNAKNKDRLDRQSADKSTEKQNKKIKDIFEKLQSHVIHASESVYQNSKVQTEHDMLAENESLLEKIDQMIDEVIDTQTDDAAIMIDKCYTHITSKDRKLPLDVCIKNLNDEIKSFKEKLDEEEKKANKMVDDMYKHQQEMRKLNTMKKQQSQLQTDKVQLQEKCREQAHTIDDKDKIVKTLTQQIVDMEVTLQQRENELSDYRKNDRILRGVKRLGTAVRKGPLAVVTRKPGQYPSNEPRLLAAKGTNPARTPRGSITSMTKPRRL